MIPFFCTQASAQLLILDDAFEVVVVRARLDKRSGASLVDETLQVMQVSLTVLCPMLLLSYVAGLQYLHYGFGYGKGRWLCTIKQ